MCLKDIQDFEEHYNELKDVLPYKGNKGSAAGKNAWYKRAVRTAQRTLPAPIVVVSG